MAQYDTLHRNPIDISVPNIAGLASSDVTIDMAQIKEDAFWAGLDANAYGIRVTLGDGVTLTNYEVTAIDVAARTGTLVIDGATLPAEANSVAHLVLWYGIPVADVVDASTATTIASPLTGYVEQASVNGRRAFELSQSFGATEPAQKMPKTTNDEILVPINIKKELIEAGRPFNGSRRWEEVTAVKMDVFDDAGASVSSMITYSDVRVVRNGVLVPIKAGTSGEDYTLALLLFFCNPNNADSGTKQFRLGIKVQDTLQGA